MDVSMLTGDNARTAAALAQIAGITDVRAELRPEDKARIISEMVKQKPTAMIGEGINDAPTLAEANVGTATGTHHPDGAKESYDSDFTGHDFNLIPVALGPGRQSWVIYTQE